MFPVDYIGEKTYCPVFHRAGKPAVRTTRRRWTLDDEQVYQARLLRRFLNGERRLGGTTTNWVETMFINRADYSAMNNTVTETGILQGTNQQPIIPAGYFDAQKGERRALRLTAMGVLSTTSAPTIIFQVRMGTTVGATQLGGASIGVSGTITTSSGVSNKWWMLYLLFQNYTPGQGSGNDTASMAGYVISPTGFNAVGPFPLEPTTPDTATWTQTFDNTVQQYINLSATWGTQSSSNTITVKSLLMEGLN